MIIKLKEEKAGITSFDWEMFEFCFNFAMWQVQHMKTNKDKTNTYIHTCSDIDVLQLMKKSALADLPETQFKKLLPKIIEPLKKFLLEKYENCKVLQLVLPSSF